MIQKIFNLLLDIFKLLFSGASKDLNKDAPTPTIKQDTTLKKPQLTNKVDKETTQPKHAVITEHIEISKPYEILTFFELKYANKSEYPTILNRKISKYFTLREAMLFDSGKQLNSIYDLSKNEELFNNIAKQAKKLDEVREFYNKPIRVTSWLRTHEWNKQVGGKPNSQHLLGTATDFIINGISPAQIKKDWYIKWSGGLGTYGGFTHMDSRPYKSRWNG